MLNTDMALVVMGHLKRGKWESVLGSKEYDTIHSQFTIESFPALKSSPHS